MLKKWSRKYGRLYSVKKAATISPASGDFLQCDPATPPSRGPHLHALNLRGEPSDYFDQKNMAEGMLCWHQAQLLTGLLSCVPCLREHQFLKLPDSKNLTGWMASSTQWT